MYGRLLASRVRRTGLGKGTSLSFFVVGLASNCVTFFQGQEGKSWRLINYITDYAQEWPLSSKEKKVWRKSVHIVRSFISPFPSSPSLPSSSTTTVSAADSPHHLSRRQSRQSLRKCPCASQRCLKPLSPISLTWGVENTHSSRFDAIASTLDPALLFEENHNLAVQHGRRQYQYQYPFRNPYTLER